MQCRWKDIKADEDCGRSRSEGFDFCDEHVRALVERGRELLRNSAAPRRVNLLHPKVAKALDKFLMAMVGAAGTTVVQHWDSIVAWAESLLSLLYGKGVGRPEPASDEEWVALAQQLLARTESPPDRRIVLEALRAVEGGVDGQRIRVDHE